MAWASLTSNQWVSRNDLQDAVTTGVFTLKAGQSIPAGNNWITRSEVETWINATVTSGTSVQWPQKSWITPITTTTTTTTTIAPGNFSIRVNNNATSTSIRVTGLILNGSVIKSYFVDPGQTQTVTSWISPLTITELEIGATNNISGYTKFLEVRKNGVLVGSGSGGENSTNFSIPISPSVQMLNGETLVVDFNYAFVP